MRRPLLAIAGLVIIALALKRKSEPASPEQPTQPVGLVPPEGRVSFYGPGFHGRQTANGEVFDQEALTAAARKPVPFGMRLKVTNLENGASVVVRVNDRGPFTKNASGEFDRVLDLSMGAARILGMIDRGVVRARIEVV